MKSSIKNLKVTKKTMIMAATGTLASVVLLGCGNKQILDLNRSFNVALEMNNGYVSIVGIRKYSDYSGSQVQFETEDGLLVLTSTHQTQLVKTSKEEDIQNYALALVGNESTRVMDYNEMQGIEIDVSGDYLNKDYLDFHVTFDKAIILSDDVATIVDLQTWKDFEDDKIQLQLLVDNNYILTSIDNVKLINDTWAQENSLFNYAVSLVGDEEKVITYQRKKTK